MYVLPIRTRVTDKNDLRNDIFVNNAQLKYHPRASLSNDRTVKIVPSSDGVLWGRCGCGVDFPTFSQASGFTRPTFGCASVCYGRTCQSWRSHRFGIKTLNLRWGGPFEGCHGISLKMILGK